MQIRYTELKESIVLTMAECNDIWVSSVVTTLIAFVLLSILAVSL